MMCAIPLVHIQDLTRKLECISAYGWLFLEVSFPTELIFNILYMVCM